MLLNRNGDSNHISDSEPYYITKVRTTKNKPFTKLFVQFAASGLLDAQPNNRVPFLVSILCLNRTATKNKKNSNKNWAKNRKKKKTKTKTKKDTNNDHIFYNKSSHSSRHPVLLDNLEKNK